jgi:type I restriction enzyme S subunit
MEKELPIGWVSVILEDLYSHVTGGDWGLDPETDVAEGFSKVVCIRGGELRNWRVDKGKTASIRLVKDSSINTRRLKIGDILLEISGGGPDQPVGRTVIIDEDVFKNHQELPKVCTNFLRLVRLVDIVNKQYINQYLQYFYSSGEVVKYQGGSNTLRNLKFGDYSSIKIPLPPLPEQQRIVAKLDTLFGHLDALKTRLDRIPQLLKDFRQKVLTQAVTGKLTEEWREGRELEEWKNIELKSVCTSITDGDHQAPPQIKEGIPFLVISNVSKGYFDFDSVTRFVPRSYFEALKDTRIPQKGDVLYTVTGSFGIPMLVDFDKEFCFQRHIAILKPDRTKINSSFLQIVLSSTKILEQAREVATGTAQLTVPLNGVRNFKADIPELDEQQEIVRRVESLFAKADKIEASYQKLKAKIEQLPQALLAKAFRGELVEQLPTDGDARDLLEEIKLAKEGLEKGGKSKKLKAEDEVRMVVEDGARYGK